MSYWDLHELLEEQLAQELAHERAQFRAQSFRRAWRGLVVCLALGALLGGLWAWTGTFDLVSAIGVTIPTILFAVFTWIHRPRSEL